MPCYAQCLGGCGGGMSGEHYIPEALLELVDAAHKGAVVVEGMKWQKGSARPIGIGRLTSGILCRDHNSALSPLDDIVTDLYRFAAKAHMDLADDSASWILQTYVNGPELERAMLKLMFGALFSGSLKSTTDAVDTSPQLNMGYELHVPLLRTLFFGDPWPTSGGLCSLKEFNAKLDSDFNVRAVVGHEHDIVGINVVTHEVHLALMLHANKRVRPSQLDYRVGNSRATLVIEWPA